MHFVILRTKKLTFSAESTATLFLVVVVVVVTRDVDEDSGQM